MTAQPPLPQSGQLSPDGMWRWDGQRWIPAAQAQTDRRDNRPRTWLWWLAGGCAVSLVVAIVAVVLGVGSLIHSIQTPCLPSDFPGYPNATQTGEYRYVGTNVAPGDSRECQQTFASNDDVATVSDFFASHLNSGDWIVTRNDTANGTIEFQRVSRPQTVGVITLVGRGQHSTFQVKLDS